MRVTLALSMLCACGAAFAQSELKIIDESNNFAAPILIVRPEIPSGVLDEAFPAKLRLRGTVTANGTFELTAIEPATGLEPFVEMLKDVLEYWRFLPQISKDCQPTNSEAAVDVWFELADAKRTVSVSVPKRAPVDPKVAANRPKPRTYVDRPRKPDYPIHARRRNAEGLAEILMQVDAEGRVLARNVVRSTPFDSFGQAAMVATRFVSFSKREDGDGNVCISIPFTFCMETNPSLPVAACEKYHK